MKAAQFLVAMRDQLRTAGEGKDDFEVEASLGLPSEGARFTVAGVSIDDNCGAAKPIVVIELIELLPP